MRKKKPSAKKKLKIKIFSFKAMSERGRFVFCNLLYFQFLTSVLDTHIHPLPHVHDCLDRQPPFFAGSVRPHLVSSTRIRILCHYHRIVLKKTACSRSSVQRTRVFSVLFKFLFEKRKKTGYYIYAMFSSVSPQILLLP